MQRMRGKRTIGTTGHRGRYSGNLGAGIPENVLNDALIPCRGSSNYVSTGSLIRSVFDRADCEETHALDGSPEVLPVDTPRGGQERSAAVSFRRRLNLLVVAFTVTIIGAVGAWSLVPSYRQKSAAKPVAQAAGASSETITVRLDTYVYEGLDQNYGSESFMRVDDDEFGYEAFSMVEFDLSSIPEGATIDSTPT